MHTIVIRSDAAIRTVENFNREHLARRFSESDSPQLAEHRSGSIGNLIRLWTISLGDAHQDARKPGHVIAIFRRKISPAVKRDAVGGQEHGHRPAAMPGHHLYGVHIYLVEVGTLFAIDFDVHKIFIHEFRDRFVLEWLVLHHMAPVTRRISNA